MSQCSPSSTPSSGRANARFTTGKPGLRGYSTSKTLTSHVPATMSYDATIDKGEGCHDAETIASM